MGWVLQNDRAPLETAWTPTIANVSSNLVGNSAISKYSIENGVVNVRGYMNRDGLVTLGQGWEIPAPVPRAGVSNIPVGQYYLYISGGTAVDNWANYGLVMMNSASRFFFLTDARADDGWPKAPESNLDLSVGLVGSTYASINFYAFYEPLEPV